MNARAICLPVIIAGAVAVGVATTPTSPTRTNIPYVEAKLIIDALQEGLLPMELRGTTTTCSNSLWRSPTWRRCCGPGGFSFRTTFSTSCR